MGFVGEDKGVVKGNAGKRIRKSSNFLSNN